MDANELSVEMAKVRGEIGTAVADLKGKDAALDDRAKTEDAKIKAVEDLAQLSDKRIDVLTLAVDHLRITIAEHKAERDKWGGRDWQLVAVAIGCVLTAAVAVMLTMAGIKKS